MKHFLIFTDLDATLVDHDTYGFEEARATLENLRERSVPVVICSSKTRAEIETYRRRMNLHGPFIVENGGAIFIPAATFDPPPKGLAMKGTYHVVELGTPYDTLRPIWQDIKAKEKLNMTGFSEMAIHEIVAHTGLPAAEARLAAMREYSEPFLFHDTVERFQVLESVAAQKACRITRGGRFFHFTGPNDKGQAVQIVKDLFLKASPDKQWTTVGLGDSANDIPMLRQVDIPVVIRRKSGEWQSLEERDSTIYSQSPGPKGWAEVMGQLLS
jgi:mannosyl-3-phosphoglycerate phosphatase